MLTAHKTFSFEMDEILFEIEKLSKEMYFNKYVDIPKIAIIPLRLLNLLLHSNSMSWDLRKNYCVSSGLIQIGIDLHEAVTNNEEVNTKKVKTRQLSILAGDYFSSIYYFLLSKASLVEGINKLAIGISEINIAKMKLYLSNNGQGFKSVEKIIELLKIRESKLYSQLISELSCENSREDWKFLIENIIIMDYLVNEIQSKSVQKNTLSYFLLEHYVSKQERNNILKTEDSSEKKEKLAMLYKKYNIQSKIKDILAEISEMVNEKISTLDDEFTQAELSKLIDQINSSDMIKVVERI